MNALARARLDDPLVGSKHALRRSETLCTLASGLYASQPANDVGETSLSYDEHASGSLFWTQKDRSRFRGGYNLYRYAKDDPINYIDRTGRNPGLAIPFLGAGSGAGLGLGAAATAAGAFAAAGASLGLAAYEAQQLWNETHTPTTPPPSGVQPSLVVPACPAANDDGPQPPDPGNCQALAAVVYIGCITGFYQQGGGQIGPGDKDVCNWESEDALEDCLEGQ